jgi:hypothetical protein
MSYFHFINIKNSLISVKTNDLQDENLIGRPLDSGINQEPHLRLKRNLSILSLKNKKHSVYHSATCDIIVIYYKIGF